MSRPSGITEKFPRDYSAPPLHPDQPLDSLGRRRNMGRPKGARNKVNRKCQAHQVGDVIMIGEQAYVVGAGSLLPAAHAIHSIGDVIEIDGHRFMIERGGDGGIRLR